MINTILFDFYNVILLPKENALDYFALVNQSDEKNTLKYFDLNTQLLEFLTAIKGRYRLYVFTNSSHLFNHPQIKPQLDKVFIEVISAKQLGPAKDNPRSYRQLAKMINTPPQEILFIDDQTKNIQAAQQAGLNSFQFMDIDQTIKQLTELLDWPGKIS